MPPVLGVVVPTARPSAWLTRLIRSLDAQTLPASEFLVGLVPGTSDPDAARALESLARNRPNVVVLGVGADELPTEWLIDLGKDVGERRPAFTTDALARLVALAESGEAAGAEAMVARVRDHDGALIDNRFVVDAGVAGSDVSLSLIDSATALVVRRHGISAPASAVRLDDPPVLTVKSWSAAEPTVKVSVASATGRWGADGCELQLEGSIGTETPDGRVNLWLVDRAAGVEHRFVALDQTISGTSFSARFIVDPRSAADGDALPSGDWRLRVGIHGDNATRYASRVAVRPFALPAALLDGLVVVPTRLDREAAFDVGGRTASPVGTVAADAVRITESARGTELEGDLAELWVVGETRLVGTVLIGEFALPATVTASDGRARLHTYLSGLAGVSPLSTRFGARAVPTGLELSIDGLGGMAVQPVPPPPPKKTAATKKVGAPKKTAATTTKKVGAPKKTAATTTKKDGAPKKTAATTTKKAVAPKQAAAPEKVAAEPRIGSQSAASTALRRARHAVPPALEPLTKKLAKNPTVKALYQRVLSR